MKKVLVLSVVAIAIFAVASFASLSLSGGGAVQWTMSASPVSLSISSSTWWLQVTGSGTGYSYTANLNPFSISSFYFTIPLMTNLSLVTGYEGNFGESVFGGSQYSGPSGNVGWVGFGYSVANYAGLQYTSSAFNAYVQTTGLSATSVSAVADMPVGPAHLYVGAYSNTSSLYAGANASVGPATLFGSLNYASGALSSYTVGAAANMGSNQLGVEYSMGNNLLGWFDLGNNVEVNASLSNGSFSDLNLKAYMTFDRNVVDKLEVSASFSNGGFSDLNLKAYKTVVGNVEGELAVSYSPSSSVSVTTTLSTAF